MPRTNQSPPPPHRPWLTRSLSGAFPAVALLGITAGMVFMAAPLGSTSSRHGALRVVNAAAVTEAEAAAVPRRGELHSALARLHFTPENLAAAGVSSGDISALVAAVAVRIGAQTPTLMELDASFRSTNARYEELKRLVQGGRASDAERAEYSTVSGEIASINADRDAILAQAKTSALAALSGGQADALNQLAAAASIAVPTEYRLAPLDSTQDQDLWVRLRDALAQQRYAQEHDETLDPFAQNAIDTLGAAESVTAARSNLANNYASVAGAWTAALRNYDE